jgi:predicted dehydrogenase
MESGLLGIGILGASTIAPAALVLPARRRDDLRATAIAARRPGAADRFASEWEIPRATQSYLDVVTDPSIDVVYVSLAVRDHAKWSIAALDAGKHVLCEKPAALTASEAHAMVDAARRNRRRLLEGFHYRHHPLFAAVQDILRAAPSGGVVEMSSAILGSRPFQADSVLHDAALGGGALRHSGCYALHWMRTLMKAEPSVTAASASINRGGADGESTVDLRFPGGEGGRILSSFNRDPTADEGPQLTVRFEHGRLEVDGLIVPQAGNRLRLWHEGDLVIDRSIAGASSYDLQLAYMIESIASGRGDEATTPDERDLVAGAHLLDDAYARMQAPTRRL